MGIIQVSLAECKDCYKCVRACPVKAIKIHSGHAEVWEERCILDGSCLNVCPQQAKQVRNDVGRVKRLIAAGKKVAASIAPSFVAALDLPEGGLVAALRRLGFAWVEETANAALAVAQAHARLARAEETRGPILTSSCPAVVNLVERHYPHLIDRLAPVVSPMVAHGRLLKKKLGEDWQVVFVGPCVAKKQEGDEADCIDAVLTFSEVLDWLRGEGVEFSGPVKSPEGKPDGPRPGVASLFPAGGGLLKTAAMSSDQLAPDVLTVTGVSRCMTFLEQLEEETAGSSYRLVEMLACEGGCLNGPCMESEASIFSRQQRLLQYYHRHSVSDDEPAESRAQELAELSEMGISLKRDYQNRRPLLPTPPEAEIERLLRKIGKYSPADELNCGACGYNSCREKAVAVYWGVAESEMCIPYMRSKAESMANVIISSTPNAVVVTDDDLKVLEINPAAERMFRKQRQRVVGRPLAELMDPGLFDKALQEKKLFVETVSYPDLGLRTNQHVFYVERQNVVVGIFTDISDQYRQKKELIRLKQETLQRAQEVIEKQMRVAQEVAGLLGETTAETKLLLSKLIQLIEDEGEDHGVSGRNRDKVPE